MEGTAGAQAARTQDGCHCCLNLFTDEFPNRRQSRCMQCMMQHYERMGCRGTVIRCPLCLAGDHNICSECGRVMGEDHSACYQCGRWMHPDCAYDCRECEGDYCREHLRDHACSGFWVH